MQETCLAICYNGATSPRTSGSWGSLIRGFASMVGSSSSSNSQGACLFPPAFGRGQAYFGSRTFLTSSEECDRTCSRSASPGFYGRLCVVPKSTGGCRPVLDLSPLNVFLRKFPFCMETPVSVRDFVRDGDWATSFDLTDVYFHITLTSPSGSGYVSCGTGSPSSFELFPSVSLSPLGCSLL